MPDPIAPDEAPEVTEPDLADALAYEPPADLGDGSATGGPRRGSSSLALKVAAVAAIVLVAAAALLLYRAQHRRKVVAGALAQADALLRLDTAEGYRKAASLLEPIALLDPRDGASVRAFALAMLFADYREAAAEAESENLLVAPGRADVVPEYAQLANASLSLGRREAGSATTALARAGGGPWARALQARVALLAGNAEAALSPAAQAATDGAFAPGLALHADVLRRLRREPAAARAAYEAALDASPLHPRAAYGLAKLALSGHAPAAQAEAALRRLVDDRGGTPSAERGRAALHLAALRFRSGDRSGGRAALDAAGVAGEARTWAETAAAVLAEHRGPYRAVSGAPVAVQSASDDDPGELAPVPPPPPAAPAASAPQTSKAASKALPKRASGKAAKASSAPKGTRKASATRTAPARKDAAAKSPAAKKGQRTAKPAAKTGTPQKTPSRTPAKTPTARGG